MTIALPRFSFRRPELNIGSNAKKAAKAGGRMAWRGYQTITPPIPNNRFGRWSRRISAALTLLVISVPLSYCFPIGPFWYEQKALQLRLDSRDYYALESYHEARSESVVGQLGMMWLVQNRARLGKAHGFADTPAGVISQMHGGKMPDFSYWVKPLMTLFPMERTAINRAEKLADDFALGKYPNDPTHGSVYVLARAGDTETVYKKKLIAFERVNHARCDVPIGSMTFCRMVDRHDNLVLPN